MPEDESNPTANKVPKSVRRISTGTTVILRLIFVAIVVFSANYLSSSYYKIWDYTRDKSFTISTHTRNLLEKTLAKRSDPVRLIVAVRKSSPHYLRLRAMAEEYTHLANGKIEVEFVDPILDSDRGLEISDTYGAVFVEDVFIIDAVPTIPETHKGRKLSSEEIERIRQAHIRYVTVEDMMVHRVDSYGIRRVVGYQDEDQITSTILSAIEGVPRKFYFLLDKSQFQDASDNTPWSFLSSAFGRQNVALVPIRISDIESIPADAEGVALVAPQYDLTEKELAILREYWARPRAALFVVLDPQLRRQPPNLRAFLREHGVTPNHDRVISVNRGRRISDVEATFTFGAHLNTVNKDLSGRNTTFEGATGSLQVREAADDLELRKIFPVALIQAAERFWGETDYEDESSGFDPATDNKPPLYLAASVIRGNERDDRVAGVASRMVVVYNSAFLHPDNIHKEQLDFLRNSTNWMIGREDLIGIGPKQARNYKLNLVPAQISFVNRLNLLILPLAFLLIGAFIWNARRS